MVAFNRTEPLDDCPSDLLSDDLLADVADLRARGRSWEEAAREVGWSVAELRRAVRHDPNFPAALARARQEIDFEAEAEALQRLRKQLNAEDAPTAMKAAQCLTKYLSDKRRDETRLEVERVRAESRAARSRAEAETEPEPPAETAEVDPAWVARRRQLERHYAEDAVRDATPVYLWGGCHKIGDTPPDATDTPLRLAADHTVRGRGVVYWAYTDPPPVSNPLDGPFLAPPGCKPVMP